MFDRSRRRRALRPLVAALSAVPPLWAQAQPVQEEVARPADPSASSAASAPQGVGLDLGSVVVTGTSTGTQKMRAGYAISTLNAEDIRQRAPRSTVDLLRSLPGVNVENSGGEGGGENVVIRALPFSGFRLLDLQEDGLPLFESNFERQLQIDELYRVDLNTKRVEMVRGGTAPIYSNNGPGGVVNFITNHGSATPQREVRLTAGSHGLRRGDVELSGPVNDALSYSLSGFYRESNGQRDTGFDRGNRGGQVKAGMTYDFAGGSVFADIKLLDDRAVFYSAIPLLDPRSGASLDGLIDRHTGTLTSASFRRATFLAGDGNGGARSVSRDLGDGIHPDVTTYTAGGDVNLGHGWTVADKARYAAGRVGFDALLNGSAADAAATLGNSLAGAKAAFAGTQSLRYVLAGTNTPYDPATTDGLVMTNTYSSTRTAYRYAVNDLRLSKAIDQAGWGKHDLGFGLQTSRSSIQQEQLGNTLLTNVRGQPNALDIQALGADGSVLGSVTQNGFSAYGSGDLVGRAKATTVSVYATETWSITRDWTADIGARHETRDEDGQRGVIGSIVAASSGPIAARTITGLTGWAPYQITHHGTAWTVGTSDQFTPTTNAFLRYSSSYSMPRFSDQWANINNGVAGTLPNGQPVPVTPIKQAEIGVKYALRDLQLSVIGFWSSFKNLNSSTYVSNAAGVLSNQALLIDTKSKGVEIEAAWSPAHWLALNGALTVQSPKITGANVFNTAYSASLDGKEIPRAPDYTLTLSPAYVFSTSAGPGRLYATVYSVGRRYQDFVNTSRLPAYTTLDLGVSSQLTTQLRFDVSLTNLTNSSGLTEGNARAPVGNALVASDASVGRPIFGRSVVASLSTTW